MAIGTRPPLSTASWSTSSAPGPVHQMAPGGSHTTTVGAGPARSRVAGSRGGAVREPAGVRFGADGEPVDAYDACEGQVRGGPSGPQRHPRRPSVQERTGGAGDTLVGPGGRRPGRRAPAGRRTCRTRRARSRPPPEPMPARAPPRRCAATSRACAPWPCSIVLLFHFWPQRPDRRLRRRRRLLRHLRLPHLQPPDALAADHPAPARPVLGPPGATAAARGLPRARRHPRGLDRLAAVHACCRPSRARRSPRRCRSRTGPWPPRPPTTSPPRTPPARSSTTGRCRSRSSSTCCGRCSSRPSPFLGRGRRPQAWWAVGLVGVTAASLATSVLLTSSDPAAAYFVTPTRVWELGLGSILALAVHHGWRLRLPAAALGARLAGAGDDRLGGDALRLRHPVPRHGRAAAHPRGGAGHRGRQRLGALVTPRPAARPAPRSSSATSRTRSTCGTGRSSSSSPYALARDLTLVEKLVAIAAVLVGGRAHQALRRGPGAPVHGARGQPAHAASPSSRSSVLVLGGAGLAVIQRSEAAGPPSSRRSPRSSTAPTASAPRRRATPAAARSPVTSCCRARPSPAPTSRRSTPTAAGRPGRSPPTRCAPTATPTATVRVALIGNSHAGHWQPALAPIAEERGWRLDTYLVVAVLHRRPRPGLRVGAGHQELPGLEPVGRRQGGQRRLRPRRHERPHLPAGHRRRPATTRRPSPSAPTPRPCAPSPPPAPGCSCCATCRRPCSRRPTASPRTPTTSRPAPTRAREAVEPDPLFAAAEADPPAWCRASTSPTGSAATGAATSSSAASSPTSTTATSRRRSRARSCPTSPPPSPTHWRPAPPEAAEPPGRRRLPGQRVDQRDADQHAEHAERHPAPEERGHRAGSGTDTVGRSESIGTEVTRTRGRRCDS